MYDHLQGGKSQSQSTSKVRLYGHLTADFGRQDWDQGFRLETWKQVTSQHGELQLADECLLRMDLGHAVPHAETAILWSLSGSISEN